MSEMIRGNSSGHIDNKPPVGRTMTNKTIVKKFAREYVKNGGNATQAALAAKPVTYDSARQTGMRLLKREDVQLEIQRALDAHGIDYDYLIDARKQFVETGLKQLSGQKKDNEPFISPADVDRHLRGIEGIYDKIGAGGESGTNSTSNHLHLHLKSPKELLTKRHELGNWFDDITDQVVEQ